MKGKFFMEAMRVMMKALTAEQLEGIAKTDDIKAIAQEVASAKNEVRAAAMRIDKVDEEVAGLRSDINRVKIGGGYSSARPPRASAGSTGSSSSTRNTGDEGRWTWRPRLLQWQGWAPLDPAGARS